VGRTKHLRIKVGEELGAVGSLHGKVSLELHENSGKFDVIVHQDRHGDTVRIAIEEIMPLVILLHRARVLTEESAARRRIGPRRECEPKVRPGAFRSRPVHRLHLDSKGP
jgi:hypothetical protein